MFIPFEPFGTTGEVNNLIWMGSVVSGKDMSNLDVRQVKVLK